MTTLSISIYQPRSKRHIIPVRIIPPAAKVQRDRARKAAYNEMREGVAAIRRGAKAWRKAGLEYKLSKM